MKSSKVNKFLIAIVVVVSAMAFNISHPLAIENTIRNYFGIEMTQDEYNTLLELGFTEDEIYYMNEETYEENKDLDATLLTRNTTYYKTVVPMFGMSYSVQVTPYEYFNHGDSQVLGSIITYYREEVATISQNGTKYRYKLTTGWLNWPSVASYDITAIGFDNSVYISSNQVFFTYTYADPSWNYTTSSVYYDKKKTAYGGSAVYLMPSNVVSLTSNIYFDVKKNTTDTLTSLTMCGDYAHAGTAVTQTQAANHSISSGGIELDPTIYSYYDETPCAYGTITGISW